MSQEEMVKVKEDCISFDQECRNEPLIQRNNSTDQITFSFAIKPLQGKEHVFGSFDFSPEIEAIILSDNYHLMLKVANRQRSFYQYGEDVERDAANHRFRKNDKCPYCLRLFKGHLQRHVITCPQRPPNEVVSRSIYECPFPDCSVTKHRKDNIVSHLIHFHKVPKHSEKMDEFKKLLKRKEQNSTHFVEKIPVSLASALGVPETNRALNKDFKEPMTSDRGDKLMHGSQSCGQPVPSATPISLMGTPKAHSFSGPLSSVPVPLSSLTSAGTSYGALANVNPSLLSTVNSHTGLPFSLSSPHQSASMFVPVKQERPGELSLLGFVPYGTSTPSSTPSTPAGSDRSATTAAAAAAVFLHTPTTVFLHTRTTTVFLHSPTTTTTAAAAAEEEEQQQTG
eukprot:GCRY01004782.1.p1 GENE.GCRY01004782.1~~GCRY01004782.1.p1  ORF type:complete len:396 (+),score=38.72 GCRY01004782.1:267-1454(+)